MKIRMVASVVIAFSSWLGTGIGLAGQPEPCYEVHAFYYPWYGNPETDGSYHHWNHQQFVKEGEAKAYAGGDDVGADFYPKLGCYSSNSDKDLDSHMRMLRRARVGVVCASWWGRDSYTDRAAGRLLDAAARHGIKVCFHIEPFPGRNAETVREAIVYIIERYGSHGAFYRHGKDNPRPMFYVYDSYLTRAKQWSTILSPDGSQTIRNTKYDSLVIGLWVKESEEAFMTEGHFDGYYTYFATDGFTYGSTVENWPRLAEWGRQSEKLFIPSVGPGYVDLRIRPWNGANTRARRDGAYYDREFAAAIDAGPQIISVTSFNEWHEGTQIEPAEPRQIPSFKYRDYRPRHPEYYLDRTRYWVGRFADQGHVEQTRYMIVVTGGELLAGAYADGHTHFLTRTLHPLGLQCVGSMCVDDKQADLKEALDYATDKVSLVIVTGGLGPTDNDVTREALSAFTGIELKEDAEVLREMAGRFRVSPAGLRANLRRQTRVPVQGGYLKNPNGTAVGLVFEAKEVVIVALPGPPRELQAMVRDELLAYLSGRFGTRLPGCSLTLRFVGLGQSQIDQTLKEHVSLAPEIAVSSQFEGGRVDFTFSLADDTPKGRARLGELKQEIMKYLGDYVYAEGQTSLEETVVKLMAARGERLALVEAGSGGALAAALSGAGGARSVLAGAYVAPTVEKLREMLGVRGDSWTDSTPHSRKVEQLAVAAADAAASQWAVAVGGAKQEEKGGGYVEVAFRLPDGRLENKRFRLGADGELERSRLSTQLLDQLRRQLR